MWQMHTLQLPFLPTTLSFFWIYFKLATPPAIDPQHNQPLFSQPYSLTSHHHYAPTKAGLSS